MLVRQAIEQDRDKWDEIVTSSGSRAFLQSWAWGEMRRKLGACWRLVFEEAGELKAVALVLRREMPIGRSWLYVPGGPVFSKLSGKASNVYEGLLELAKKEGAVFVRVDSFIPEGKSSLVGSGWRKSEREVQPRHTLILDLQESEEKLLANMHHKTRYNIRLAQRKGVEVRFSRELRDIEEFLRLSKDVKERGSFHFHPHDYYRAMLEALAPAGMLELAVAELDGVVLAVYLLVTFGDMVTYAHGATSSAKRDVMAPHLLMWESIRRAKSGGAKHFDFFGVAPPFAQATGGKPHAWSGITRFKEGFGGRREDYAGAYDYVLQPGMYALFNLARRVRGVLR